MHARLATATCRPLGSFSETARCFMQVRVTSGALQRIRLALATLHRTRHTGPSLRTLDLRQHELALLRQVVLDLAALGVAVPALDLGRHVYTYLRKVLRGCDGQELGGLLAAQVRPVHAQLTRKIGSGLLRQQLLLLA